uniref:HIT-type domain-containing protein n=1 Tax=Oryza rufipogon TaxID=4529 RepID=A0A0E0N4H5_ORYRU
MAGGSCDVCKEAPSKYKCPACRTPYCSVACFKNHKDKFCQKTIPLEEVSKSSLQEEILSDTTCPTQYPNTLHSAKSLEVEDPSWLVDKNGLRSLAESNEIRDALKDCKLQQMLLKIDGSAEPEKILDIVSPQQ